MFDVTTHPDFDGHSGIHVITDRDSGLKAIIALHWLDLGVALGGCRMRPYPTFDDALTDVLRLSRGMTYKSAMAGLPFGGGKSVIFGDPRTDKTPARLRAFGRAVNRFAGNYYTGEDMGMEPEDFAVMAEETDYIIAQGIPAPGPYTARGVLRSIESAIAHVHGSDSLEGRSVAIQGIGHVGWPLMEMLRERGAKVYVADTEETRLARAQEAFQATVAPVDQIHAVECDVFSPCAIGSTLTPQTVSQMQARIVAGSANNQLKTPDVADQMAAKGVLYAPDYVANGGGLVYVGRETMAKRAGEAFDVDAAVEAIDLIRPRCDEIFARAARDQKTTAEVSDQMALEVIAKARGEKPLPHAA